MGLRLRRAPARDAGEVGGVRREAHARRRARARHRPHRGPHRDPRSLRRAGARVLRLRRDPVARRGRGRLGRRPRRSSATSTGTTSRSAGVNTPWRAIDWGPKHWASAAADLRARVARRGVPRGRRAQLLPESRRGLGRDVPPDGRAQERDHDRDLAHHQPGLLPGRGGAPGGRAGRSPALDGGDDVVASSAPSGNARRRSGGSRSRRRSTESCSSRPRCRAAGTTRSRSWRRTGERSSGGRSGSGSGRSGPRRTSAASARCFVRVTQIGVARQGFRVRVEAVIRLGAALALAVTPLVLAVALATQGSGRDVPLADRDVLRSEVRGLPAVRAPASASGDVVRDAADDRPRPQRRRRQPREVDLPASPPTAPTGSRRSRTRCRPTPRRSTPGGAGEDPIRSSAERPRAAPVRRPARPDPAPDQPQRRAAPERERSLRRDLHAAPELGFASRFTKYVVYYDGPSSRTTASAARAAATAPGWGSRSCPCRRASASRPPPSRRTSSCTRSAPFRAARRTTARCRTTATRATTRATSCTRSSTKVRWTRSSSIPVATTTTGTRPSFGDSQDSPWLVQLDRQAQLPVNVSGPGTVVADVPGSGAQASCTTTWNAGTRVTLSASPPREQARPLERLAARAPGPARVTVGQGATVTALFAPAVFRLTVGVSGRGTVRSSRSGSRAARGARRRCRRSSRSGSPPPREGLALPLLERRVPRDGTASARSR